MSKLARPLTGIFVGLSISECEQSSGLGYPPGQINRLILQVTSALLGQGAGLIFGHDWRRDGVMEAVHGFAQEYQPSAPFDAEGKPLLRNIVPWPDVPLLSKEELTELSATLSIEQAGLPPLLRPERFMEEEQEPSSRIYRYLRARGLTHLRHRLNDECDARVCIGGRTSGSRGRCPGVIEEALIALQAAKPLYLVGMLGGATAQVIAALQSRSMPDDFCPAAPELHGRRAEPMASLYANPPVLEPGLASVHGDLVCNRRDLWGMLQQTNLDAFCQRNFLTNDENTELFKTPMADVAIKLILTGIYRMIMAGEA